MKRIALIVPFLLMILATKSTRAQNTTGYRTLFRIYEDNDFMNIWGNGSDKGYTNGTRLDIFYIKSRPSRFFMDRWMLKAGNGSVNTFGWGLMQMMMTPMDIHLSVPDKNDYPYSGALFALHSLHSGNSVKKYNIQTEWMIGLLGPPSLAEQTQTFIHRLINYQKPMGWSYQIPADLILNLNLAAEKQIAHINNSLELIGGARLLAGTALNGASLYSLIRFGKMQPYFNGYISQYTGDRKNGKGMYFYFLLRPSVEWMPGNAFIEGGVFTQLKADGNETRRGEAPGRRRKRIIGRLDYGLVATSGRVSLSFTQTTVTPLIKTVGNQTIGNLSLHIAWGE